MSLGRDQLHQLAKRIARQVGDDAPSPPLERFCTCQVPIWDRRYLGWWWCRWCAAGEELGARSEAPREGPLRIPSEIAITGEVADALRTLGCEVFGTPLDRVAIGVPHLFAQHAEWKVAAWITIWPRWRRLTRVQRDWHGECRATGVRVLTVRSARDAVEQFSALPSYLEGPPPMPFSFTLTTYAGPRMPR